MDRIEKLRKCLEKARKELNGKGVHFDPKGQRGVPASFAAAKPFEVAYQHCIERVFPEVAWWEVTNFWDIADNMVAGLSDEEAIDEIIRHVDPKFTKPSIGEAHVEEGHTIEEYMDRFGDMYSNGELKSALDEEFAMGIAEADASKTYWHIDGEMFETPLTESKELTEGTSNFRTPDELPLLVFYTAEEVEWNMEHDDGYPKEDDFEDEEGNIDYDAFEQAKQEFQDEYFDAEKVAILWEDDVERLEDRIHDFNEKTKEASWSLYDRYADKEDGISYDDSDFLKEVEVKVEPGYYSAAQISIEHEDYLDELSDKAKGEQKKRFADFFDELKKSFGLTELGISWGPASNGETGYKIIESDESAKCESGSEEEWECQNCHGKFPATDEGGRVESDMGFICHDCIGKLSADGIELHFEDEKVEEDTVKQGSHWVNKGKEGTHGKFRTKKAADAQRKAMFANGYKEAKEALKYPSVKDVAKAIASMDIDEGADQYAIDEITFRAMDGYLDNNGGIEHIEAYSNEWDDLWEHTHAIVLSEVAAEGYEILDENIYDGKKGGHKGETKTKIHVRKNAGDPKKNMEIFNHLMGADRAPTQQAVALGEEEERNDERDFNKEFFDFLNLIEFKLNKQDDGSWSLVDSTGANLGDIESDRFESAVDIVGRVGVYIDDYILKDEEWGDFDSLEEVAGDEEHPLREMADMLINHLEDVELEKVWEIDHPIEEAVVHKTARRGKIPLKKATDGKLEEARIDERKYIEATGPDGKKYGLELRTESTRNYAYEYAVLEINGEIVSDGKYRWMNRPWYKFQYAPSIVDAFDHIGFKELAKEAVNASSDAQGALEHIASKIGGER